MCLLKYSLADENRSISPGHSPGPVKNSEKLLRVLHQPEHIKDGELIETTISLKDLKSKGFSVDRKAYINPESLREKVAGQVRRNPENREASFSSELFCGNLRELFSEGKRDFLIVDEINEKETPVNRAHASIYSANVTGDSGLRRLRSKLLIEINRKIITHDDLLKEISCNRNNPDIFWQTFVLTKNWTILIMVAILFLSLGSFLFFIL